MQDRYLFRGKRIDNGEWVIGNRIDDGVTGQVFIHAVGNSVNESDKVGKEGCLQFVAFEVDPSTICQCTGFKDGNDVLIFEKDIISTYVGDAIIVWSDGEWKVKFIKDNMFQKNLHYWAVEDCYMEEVRVIGDLIL